MATVFIPPTMRSLTGEVTSVELDGKNVRQIIQKLDEAFPGAADWLCDDHQLRPGLSVSVGGQIATLGLLQPVTSEDEIHFLPIVGGG